MSNLIETQPLVSVVMPAFNSEQYIQAAIDSVRKQTLTDWELIVIDDCSTDSTYEIVCDAAREDTRIKVKRNSRNCGAAVSRNAGMLMSRGQYVALLDSDDLWEPAKLEKQVKCAIEYNADIVYCSYSIIDELGKKRAPDFIVPLRSDFNLVLVKSTISCSTALIRRKWTKKYQLPTNMYHEDLAYWLCLLKNGAIAIGIQEVLASYRVIRGSRAFNKPKSALNRWKIYHSYLGFSILHSSTLLIKYMLLGLIKYRRLAR